MWSMMLGKQSFRLWARPTGLTKTQLASLPSAISAFAPSKYIDALGEYCMRSLYIYSTLRNICRLAGRPGYGFLGIDTTHRVDQPVFMPISADVCSVAKITYTFSPFVLLCQYHCKKRFPYIQKLLLYMATRILHLQVKLHFPIAQTLIRRTYLYSQATCKKPLQLQLA